MTRIVGIAYSDLSYRTVNGSYCNELRLGVEAIPAGGTAGATTNNILAVRPTGAAGAACSAGFTPTPPGTASPEVPNNGVPFAIPAGATVRVFVWESYDDGGATTSDTQFTAGTLTVTFDAPPYNPCATFNPVLALGSNSVAMDATAPDLALSGCGDTAFKANYFKFVPPLSASYSFSTCSSGVATRMAVLDGCAAGSAQLACNDDGDGCGSSAVVSASLTAGQTYYVVVGSETAGATLPSTLAVAVDVDGSGILSYRPNWVVPATTDGLYINVETQQTGATTASVPGWDLNPWSSSSLSWFSPAAPVGGPMLRFPGATTGSAGNLAVGTPVGGSGSYSSGAVTFGTAPGNWTLNSADNYFGFRYVGASGLIHYGWGRMTVGATATVRTVTEIAVNLYPNQPINVGDGAPPVPPYDPCAPFNPTLAVGTNNVPLNQSTATDLSLSGCGGTAFKANYFKFVAPETGSYTFSTCSSGQATRMAVLDGCEAGSTQLACNDDGGDDCGSSARLSVSLTSAQIVYVVVGGESSSTTLPESISVGVLPPPVADCVSAATAQYGNNAISDTVNLGKIQFVFANTTQTVQNPIVSRQFFKFTPTATGAFKFKTCEAGDTKLAIATSCPLAGAVGNTIAFNDDAPTCFDPVSGSAYASWIDATNNGSTNNSTFGGFFLSQDLVAGTTYYVIVGGYSDTTWDGFLVIEGPEGTLCRADIDGNSVVGGSDLSALLAAWGTNTPNCDLDIPPDGNVSGTDLAALLAAWGPCAP